jgi:hypothetical protein
MTFTSIASKPAQCTDRDLTFTAPIDLDRPQHFQLTPAATPSKGSVVSLILAIVGMTLWQALALMPASYPAEVPTAPTKAVAGELSIQK